MLYIRFLIICFSRLNGRKKTITYLGYLLPKNKFLICFKFIFDSVIRNKILRALNVRHLIRLTLLDLGAKASQLKYEPVNVGFLYMLVPKANEGRSTNTSKNGNWLSFYSSIVKVRERCKNCWKNYKASLREQRQAKVLST